MKRREENLNLENIKKYQKKVKKFEELRQKYFINRDIKRKLNWEKKWKFIKRSKLIKKWHKKK